MSVTSIDTTFDVRTDAGGKDPDSHSRTLKRYHQVLWSKPLPNGRPFGLVDDPNGYLIHSSSLGDFYLSSDSVVHTYYRWKRMAHITGLLDKEELCGFVDLAYTIGGFLVFPGNRINGLPTLNQERGTNRMINDRLDLTLECIRRHYLNEPSPLSETIRRYSDFFALFTDFKGYCEHFLLQDLLNADHSSVNFFLPFSGFIHNPLPHDVTEYRIYRDNNLSFLQKRNARIERFDRELFSTTETL
ncbi:MAG: hypothetical protein RL021_801 [Bacteroidota bacterium]